LQGHAASLPGDWPEVKWSYQSYTVDSCAFMASASATAPDMGRTMTVNALIARNGERIGPYLTLMGGRMYEQTNIRWCTAALEVLSSRLRSGTSR
jgi:hypothetical protein